MGFKYMNFGEFFREYFNGTEANWRKGRNTDGFPPLFFFLKQIRQVFSIEPCYGPRFHDVLVACCSRYRKGEQLNSRVILLVLLLQTSNSAIARLSSCCRHIFSSVLITFNHICTTCVGRTVRVSPSSLPRPFFFIDLSDSIPTSALPSATAYVRRLNHPMPRRRWTMPAS